MNGICRRCFHPLREGQKATVVVTATFHRLKSEIHYALDKADLVADPDTLVHASGIDCIDEDYAD
jgi:hypothetical protein